MAQARRKPVRNKAKKSAGGGSMAGVGMLLAGMLIGSLATILWQGARTDDDGIGAGIRQMFGAKPPLAKPNSAAQNTAEKPQPKPSTEYDFFHVLPEIEVVIPGFNEPLEPEDKATESELVRDADTKSDAQKPSATAESSPPKSTSSYMLQAASYKNRDEAERLKATLALNGLASLIQKISIQGRGDFYRVRLGPYASVDAMRDAETKLARAGIKALRLKVSKAG